jgi:hypothetical protein
MSKSLRLGRLRAPLRREICAIAATLSLLVAACSAGAANPQGASTSPQSRLEARRAVPLAKIDPQYRDAVREVLADPSLYRRLPTNVVDCQPELFTFLGQNPEVLVEIWRHLGVSQVELTRTGENTYTISDGAGTTGNLVVVEQNCNAAAQNRIVMYAEGRYEGKPFNQPLAAKCVVLLRSGSMTETNGRTFVAARLDSFIKLDRMSVELVAKAVHPFIGQTADRNFADTLAFVSNFSYTAERRPEAIERMAGELDAVDQPRRQKLVKLAYATADAGKQWRLTRAGEADAEISPR